MTVPVWFVLAFLVMAFEVIVFFLGFLTYYWFFLRQNDFTKCRVFLPNIDKPKKGYLLHSGNTGYTYCYGKNKDVIFVPKSYNIIYHWHVRILYLNNIGGLIASPFADDTPMTSDEKGSIIKELTLSKIGTDMLLAMKGKSNAGLMIVIIVALLMTLVAGGIGYAMHKPAPYVVTTNVTQPQNGVVKQGSGQSK